jgi:predicted RNA-binding protein Jag
MTQKTKSRIVIDTNKHGIRRETNLDKVAQKAAKKRQWESNPRWKKDKKLSTDTSRLSTEISTDI